MIIGISGKKFHGKDTLADFLVSSLLFTKISYAQPLKDICRILFNFSEEQLYGLEKEDVDPHWNITPRACFQFIGTDLFRNQMNKLIPDIKHDFWIHCLMHKLKPDQNYVIPDVRFPNEAQAIKDKGGIIIKIIRPDLISHDSHESESLIDSIPHDYIIYNNSTKENLYSQISSLLSSLP